MPHLLRFTVTHKTTTSLWFVVSEHLDQTYDTTINLLAHGCHPNEAFQQACYRCINYTATLPTNPHWEIMQQWLRQNSVRPHRNPLAVELCREALIESVECEEHARGDTTTLHSQLSAIVWLCPKKFQRNVPVICNAICADNLNGATYDSIDQQWIDTHPAMVAAVTETQRMRDEAQQEVESIRSLLRTSLNYITDEPVPVNPYETEEMQEIITKMRREMGEPIPS